MGSKVKLTLLCLLAVGVLDHLYATQSSADSTVRRLGLHQDKSQAYWLYFFIAHIYDGILVRACRCQPTKPRQGPMVSPLAGHPHPLTQHCFGAGGAAITEPVALDRGHAGPGARTRRPEANTHRH